MAIFFHTFTFTFFISTMIFFQLNITDGAMNNKSAKQSDSDDPRSRKCFFCNSVEHGKDCLSIKKSGSSTDDLGNPPHFTMKCNGPCNTIISLSGDVIVRGCGDKYFGIGCIVSGGAISCFCDKDYCNTSTGQNIRSCTSILKLLVVMFAVYYYIHWTF